MHTHWLIVHVRGSVSNQLSRSTAILNYDSGGIQKEVTVTYTGIHLDELGKATPYLNSDSRFQAWIQTKHILNASMMVYHFS
jgi:hypothetical protein